MTQRELKILRDYLSDDQKYLTELPYLPFDRRSREALLIYANRLLVILTLVFFGLLFLFGIKLWYEYHLIGKILLVFFYFGTVCMYILAKTEINKEVSSTSPEYVVLSFLALFLLPVLLILVPVAILFLIAMALRKDPPIKAAPLTPSNAYPDKKID